MTDNPGLVFACLMDGNGGGSFGGWDLVKSWTPEQGMLWVHLDFRHPTAVKWVEKESGLGPLSAGAIVAEATRPRATLRGESLLVDLRGVNLNPGATPDDMVSLRMHLEPARVITARHRRLMAVHDLSNAVREGGGPRDTGGFLATVGEMLLQRMGDSLESLDEQIDGLHDRIETDSGASLRSEVSRLRNQVISLRRYLAPQRDALARLVTDPPVWMSDLQRERIREIADRTTRHIEDLEAARDRAQIAHEELSNRMAEQMNRTMYVLAIVAAIFLPLGLLTGILGVNVGGIPGTDDESAFWILCGVMVVLAAAQVWVFRRMRWL